MSHRVILAPGGRQFTAETGQILLDAALDAGLNLAYGCRNGACRSCRARLIDGQLSHPSGPPAALSARERAGGYVLLCQASAATDVTLEVEELDASGLIHVRSLPLRLVEKAPLGHDVMKLTLALPANEQLHFRAGQYIDIVMRDGRRRAFSLANPSSERQRLELHIRHVPGGSFSGYVFDSLRERALLRMHGPLGNFYLRDGSDSALLFVAGGTGFAPIKSIVESALADGVDRPMHVYCGARARRDLYMHEIASRWCEQWPQLRYTPVLSEPDDDWPGRTGLVHEAVLEDFGDLGSCAVYASGPPPMVNAIRESFPAAGAHLDQIFSDAFDHAHQTGHDD